jgi:DNA polymerase III alpha subunit
LEHKKLKARTSLSCRRKMTTQELIREIQRQNPLISQEQILERLAAERAKTGGLLGDETLLRLIAAKFGLQVQQNTIQNSGVLSTSRLFAGLYDVTVAGRLIAVFPAKTFQGAEKSGKFATIMLTDTEGVLRVVLWDSNAEMVERGELKAGQVVRLIHGYTKGDKYGKTELHLGNKGKVLIEAETKADQYESIEKFTAKIQTLNSNSGNVHLAGTVKAILGKKAFSRNDDSDGTVMRLALRDESGEVTVVVWNEKVAELEVLLRENTNLLLVNARVKETQSGGLEVHVDSNTFVGNQASSI